MTETLGQGTDHETLVIQNDAGYIARCKCGAVWTYGKERDADYRRQIWESHVDYFAHAPTQTP